MALHERLKDVLKSIPDILDIQPLGMYEEYNLSDAHELQRRAWSITCQAMEESIRSFKKFAVKENFPEG